MLGNEHRSIGHSSKKQDLPQLRITGDKTKTTKNNSGVHEKERHVALKEIYKNVSPTK